MAKRKSRKTIDTVTGTLRSLGVVDRFSVTELFEQSAGITEATLTKQLRTNPAALPAGMSASYVAGMILAAVARDASADETKTLTSKHIARLTSIKPGRRHAATYHRHIFRILSLVFEGSLRNGKVEQPLGGVKRIDIVFENSAKEGFFRELTVLKGLRAPYIPFECKNYREDPANPEFDQLNGRLNANTGVVGFLVCRKSGDKTRNLQRARTLKPHVILVLDDQDVVQLAKWKMLENHDAIDRFLLDKLRELEFA